MFCRFTEVLLLNVCNEAVRVCSRVFKDNDKEGRKWWRAAKKLPVCPTQPSFFGSCNNNMTSSQINDTFLFHRVLKILTGGRILQISIARCQIEAEIHSFPTMYGKGGGRCGKNWRNQGFRPKIMPKTRFF